jgi:DNA ligase (NAD+)
VVERIIHFVSKDAMDIRSLGEANVRKFFELALLTQIPGIYTLNFDAISTLEGFGKKSIDNLKAAIEASKQQPLYRLLYGLGIRFVGETTAKTIANHVTHLLELKHYTIAQLMELEDIGPKVATSIYEFFQAPESITLLEQLETLGLQLTNTKKPAAQGDGQLQGKTFLFTGTLTQMKRSEAEALVEANGGKLLSGVSSKLNYLIVGDDAGSKLEKAKKINTISILTEAEFLHMVQSTTNN